MNIEQANRHTILILPTFLGRIFGRIKNILIEHDKIVLTEKNNQITEYNLLLIDTFPYIKETFFSAKIGFKYKQHNISFSGLSKKKAALFFQELEKVIVLNIESKSNQVIEQFSTLAENQYLRDSNVAVLDESARSIMLLYKENKLNFDKHFDKELNQKLNYISLLFPINESNLNQIRKNYENYILDHKKHFFDVIESNPLTEQQRLAVIRNNDINMVLAAAGTGKTSVMVAKALDLISSGMAKSNEILILAYNKDAAVELAERLESRAKEANLTLEQSPNISTFHALGRHMIKACGRPIHLSKFAEDPIRLDIWFGKWIENYIKENPNNLAKFIQLIYQPINPFQFKTKDEYDKYIRDNEYRTLQGERVRGYQELLIANWLFLNGIDYEYESKYISKCRIDIGFDYKPDFYLGNGIYLEHFGIDREGKTRPDIDAVKYNENIKRKRELHLEHKTTLIETYHYNWTENNLDQRLAQLMSELSISLKPKSDDEVFEILDKLTVFKDSKKRYLKCLQAIRTERLNNQQILQRLTDSGIVYAQDYTNFLVQIHNAYVKELNESREIDFDDMILQATQLIKSGDFQPKWKYILVDEFQDISMARLELLKEIYIKGPRPIWTVVGDDWQSIYRFSGGKLEVTTRFKDMIGSHTLSKLEKTYRYNNSIADIAGQFIMKNPEQYQKNVVTHTQVTNSCVHLYDSYVVEEDKVESNISAKTLEILNEIRSKDPDGSIAILARYRYLLDDVKNIIKDKNIKFWTFHGSKGLEADYCILLGFFQGKTGFPNQNKEEAIIEALLPMLDSFPNSEERRLFYVALTRAKRESYLIADADAPSEFINELLSSKYKLNVVSERFKKQYRDVFKCHVCSTGYYVMRKGQYGSFYSCSSGSVCQSSPRVCSKCESPSIDTNNKSICQNPNCCYEFPVCDKCGRPMVLRDGKFGKFWGCSGYGVKSDQCSNTRKYSI